MPRYRKRKDGLYATRVTIGHSLNGTPIIKTVYAKTQAILADKVSRLKSEGIVSHNNFGKIANEWMAEKSKTVSYKTAENYREMIDKLSSLNSKDIEKITPYDVQEIINNLYAKGYSKTLLTRVRLVYGGIADFAIKNNFKVVNYIKQIEIPTNAPTKRREALTDQEINIINKNVNAPFGLYAYLMLYTGLRRGEMLALKWADIDIENKLINVNKAVEYINNQPHLKTTKTSSGIRKVPILDNVLPYLTKQPENKDMFIFGDDRIYSETMSEINAYI